VAALAIEPSIAQVSSARIVRAPAHPPPAASADNYATAILAGISNQGRTQRQPYVTAGDRTYLIGTQDGNFPDMGHHVPGEMGGLWLPPIKLIDAFQARIAEAGKHKEILLAQSAQMLTYPYGNRFSYGRVLDDLEVERLQFSPDQRQGVIIQYRFKNTSARARQLRFQWSVKTDLRPGWYADHRGVQDGQDVVDWRASDGVFIARDTDNPWFCVWGAMPPAKASRVEHPDPIATNGRGITAASIYTIAVGAHASATLTFVVSGSTTGRNDALAVYDDLARHHGALLMQKVAHFASMIQRARIRIPDQRLQDVYTWSRINMEWLIRDVPGIGRGLSAGFMEYPWWFGTETYSLQALMRTGDFELVKQTLRLLRSQSAKVSANGRIAHEITTAGVVANPGNTQETAQFVLTVGQLLEWSGDLQFAREMYPAMKKGIDWLLGEMDQNKDLFPEGYGIMEVYGLNAELIDVAVYTQQALQAAARVAKALNDTDAEGRYRQLASELKEKINQRFWIEQDGTYGDFYGSRAQAISAADGAIKQIGLKSTALTQADNDLIAHYQALKAQFSAMPEGDRAWITNENWVIATPMETGIAPRARAISLLDKIRRENTGQYGPYLSAVNRRSMMTISTGVEAVAEGKYGRTDQAMWDVDRIAQTFDLVSPGSMSEMMPDRGCFTIAWTSYGIVLPLIEHVFGFHPDAPNKTVVLEPHLPSGWENISIGQLPIGTNLISFSRTRTAKGVIYDVESKDNGWNFVLSEAAVPGSRYFLNGKPVTASPSRIRMRGKKNQVLITSLPKSRGTVN
jgi:glycogen debranching enzyme